MVSRRIQHCKEFLSECDYLSRPEIGGTYSAEAFMKLFSAATRLLSFGKDEGVSPNPKLLWGFLSFLCRTRSGPPSPRGIPQIGSTGPSPLQTAEDLQGTPPWVHTGVRRGNSHNWSSPLLDGIAELKRNSEMLQATLLYVLLVRTDTAVFLQDTQEMKPLAFPPLAFVSVPFC